jgi:hypothetical protein
MADTKATSGYSGTPLPKKIGLKEGGSLVMLRAPKGMEALFSPLPMGAAITTKLTANAALVILFCGTTAMLKKEIAATAKKLAADGALWVSWPKKSSTLFQDLTEDVIREVVLPMGLVDVKVCAVNQDWSGLKLMVRKEFRAQWNT